MVDRHASRVLSLCLASGLHRSDAEDVCQEVMVSAFRGLRTFGGCRLSTWLYRIARRRVADHFRSPKRRDRAVGFPGEPSFPSLPDAGNPGPEDEAIAESRRRRVLGALGELGEPSRTILLAYHVGEVPVADIAHDMGLPVNTVKSHLRRGRLALRGRLGKES